MESNEQIIYRSMEEKEYKNFIPKNIQILLTVAGVVVALLNIWIVAKLAPISENISVVSTKVDALQENQNDFVGRPEWSQRLIEVNNRLDRMESKIDRLLYK